MSWGRFKLGLAAFLCSLTLWPGDSGPGEKRWTATPSFADKLETKDAVIYRAQPQDVIGAQEQRLEEERKQAESWEMLRRLSIEIERPQTTRRQPFPASSKPKAVR